MKLPVRNLMALFSRSLPYFKGKYKLGLPLVRLMTNNQIDSDCLVNIEMQDGSKMTLDLRNRLEQLVFLSGEHDKDIIELLSRVLHPGVVIFDVGANIGLYSIAFGEKLRKISGNCQIWAFEPVPSNFKRLVDMIEVNQLTNIISPVNTALGNQKGEIQLCMVDEDNNASTGNAFMLKEGLVTLKSATCSSPIITLDEFAQNNDINKCDIIKIDIEGAEMDFLLGGINFIKKTRPIIYGEFNPFWVKHFGYSFVDVAKLFIPLRYRLFQQFGPKNIVEIKEVKQGISDVLMVPQEKSSGKLEPFNRNANELNKNINEVSN